MKDDSFDCTLIAHLRIFLLFYRLLYCLILPENRLFFGIWKVVEIEKVLAHIDAILSAAMEDWNKTTNHAALRCPPMIFPLPKGQESNIAEFAVILKMDNDGDTVVYSPIPLPHLENQ